VQKRSLNEMHTILADRSFAYGGNVLGSIETDGARQLPMNATRRNSIVVDWNEYQKQIGTTLAELAITKADD
jgi:hypothetical protein